MIRSVVRGFGAALPKRVVTNQELESKVDTSDEWIVQRTGIRQRYIAGEGETISVIVDGIALPQRAANFGGPLGVRVSVGSSVSSGLGESVSPGPDVCSLPSSVAPASEARSARLTTVKARPASLLVSTLPP